MMNTDVPTTALELYRLTVKELRNVLKPYGTPHRSSMTKPQLVDAILRIQLNEVTFGQPEAPAGEFFTR